MATRGAETLALAQVKRLAVADHILAAARHLVLQSGLDITMDQLAEVTGVSRRTLFRHFATREKLLAAAFDAGMVGYRDQLPRYRPGYDGDVDGWLRDTCAAAHRMNTTIGPGFFELASKDDLSPDLIATEQRRRTEFRSATADIAATLWRALGNRGSVPQSLTDTVAAQLSPFFTAAMTIDADRDWQSAGAAAYAAISAAARSATTTR